MNHYSNFTAPCAKYSDISCDELESFDQLIIEIEHPTRSEQRQQTPLTNDEIAELARQFDELSEWAA